VFVEAVDLVRSLVSLLQIMSSSIMWWIREVGSERVGKYVGSNSEEISTYSVGSATLTAILTATGERPLPPGFFII
jgi:hypothetical protein